MHGEAWAEVRIGDLGEVFTGRTPPTEHPAYFGDDYPFITPGDMHQGKYARATERSVSHEGAELLKRIKIPENSVCVSCIGWQMGETIITAKPSFTNQQINTIVPNCKVEPSFLYYSLRPRKRELLSLGSAIGVRTPILKKSAFSDLKVKIPPLQVQQRIAAILSAYDDLIENNARRIKILEEMAQAVYREWFVHFRFPGHEKAKMVLSPVGPIPQGWNSMKVGDVANVLRGRSYRGEELVDVGGLPFLNLKCIDRDGGFRPDGIKRYSGAFKESQTARLGDIVMAVTDMTQERRIVARAARVPRIEGVVAVFSMDLVKVEPKGGTPSDYLYGVLRYSSFSDAVKQHANGVNVLHLSPDRIGDFVFPCAPSHLQTRYAEFAQAVYSQCGALESENTNLRRTRDLLLPKLISGEIDVSNLDTRM